jgi:hypothetical protein
LRQAYSTGGINQIAILVESKTPLTFLITSFRFLLHIHSEFSSVRRLTPSSPPLKTSTPAPSLPTFSFLSIDLPSSTLPSASSKALLPPRSARTPPGLCSACLSLRDHVKPLPKTAAAITNLLPSRLGSLFSLLSSLFSPLSPPLVKFQNSYAHCKPPSRFHSRPVFIKIQFEPRPKNSPIL